MPISPWTGKPDVMSAEQERAIDPEYIREHPTEAALERYYNPFYGPQQGMYTMGTSLRNGVMNAPSNPVSRQLDKGPGMGALTLGGIGAVSGGIAGAITDAVTGREGTAKRLALLLGLGGAGLGALSGYMRQSQDKAASWREGLMSGDPRDALVEAVNNMRMMNFNDRMRALAAIPQLSTWQAQQLASQISTMGGAAAGAAIMHFLFGAGLMGTLAGGFAGGMLGRSFNPPQRLNSLGLPSMSGFDFNGNPLF